MNEQSVNLKCSIAAQSARSSSKICQEIRAIAKGAFSASLDTPFFQYFSLIFINKRTHKLLIEQEAGLYLQ